MTRSGLINIQAFTDASRQKKASEKRGAQQLDRGYHLQLTCSFILSIHPGTGGKEIKKD